jgi:hypothetical protein
MKPFSELSWKEKTFIELMVFRCQVGFISCEEFLKYCNELTGFNFGNSVWYLDNLQGEFLYIHPKNIVDKMKDYVVSEIEPVKVFPVRFIERMEANKIPISKDHVTMMSRAKALQQVSGSEKYKYLKPARVKRDIKFTVPTVEMVFQFMKEKTSSTSYATIYSQKFFNYYSIRDWKIQGKKQMENWKLSVAGWVERNFDQIPIILDEPEENSKDWETEV